MEETEEVVTTGRRTRSGKAAKTPAKASKPTTRRTRKKVVLMEVEVSDDDEDTPLQERVNSETKDSSDVDEEKALAAVLEASATPSKKKKVSTVESVDSEEKEDEKLNGNEIPVISEDSMNVVFNDIEMLVAEESEISSKSLECKIPDEIEKMEVEVSPKKDVENKEKEKIIQEVDVEEVVGSKVAKVEKTDIRKPDENIEIDQKEAATEECKTDKSVTGDIEKKIKESSPKVERVELKELEKIEDASKTKESEQPSKAEECKELLKVEKEQNLKKKTIHDQSKETNIQASIEEEVKDYEKVKQSESSETQVQTSDPVKEEKVKSESPEKKHDIRDPSEEEKVVEQTKKVDEKVTVDKTITTKIEEVSKIEEMEVDEPVSEPITVEKAVESETTIKDEIKNDDQIENTEEKESKSNVGQNGDPDAENISEDELPGVPVVKVPEAEEVSDEELPGPKRAELPADTEVVSEDELPSVKTEPKKESKKRKLDEADYDPGSPTSENETPMKKPTVESTAEKEKEEKSPKPKKLPELDKYWKAVNDDPTDFTGWTYLLQYVDQENDMEAAREAYDAFLSHYPYCYGYWRKYADYEKRKGNKKKCEEVFERGLKAIPLSVDLWIHYLTYVKATRSEEEEFVRSQFERALAACGLEFRSDRLWDSYIKWETEGKRLQRVTGIYDKLLATPTQGYTTHFDNFQEHVASNPPNKIIEIDEFLALRKEVRHMLKHDVTTEAGAPEEASDAPPGDDDLSKITSSDEETKSIRERIVSIRRKAHKGTVNAVTSRWNYEEGIKRPYFHVKPLERCQLKNWQDYLDYETEQGDRTRIIVLFERCLIACALYEEFWLKFVHYLEGLKDAELQTKIRDVYERACTIHHLKKPGLHLQWAMFEESVSNTNRAAEILVNLEKSVPNILQIAYRRINLERRRSDFEKCTQLYEHYINNSKNKMISSNIAIKFSRFCFRVMKDFNKAQEVLKAAIAKDINNPRLYLQLVDLTLQKENVTETEVVEVIDSFLDRETTEPDQKVLFAQRKLEYLEDFGNDIYSVQVAYDAYQKYIKQNKDSAKKKETKSEPAPASKKEKSTTQTTSQSSSYGNYGAYGNSSAQPAYPYSGSQQGQYNYSQYGQGDQYQYQNWQYPQGGYGGYNQWGGYSGGYGY